MGGDSIIVGGDLIIVGGDSIKMSLVLMYWIPNFGIDTQYHRIFKYLSPITTWRCLWCYGVPFVSKPTTFIVYIVVYICHALAWESIRHFETQKISIYHDSSQDHTETKCQAVHLHYLCPSNIACFHITMLDHRIFGVSICWRLNRSKVSIVILTKLIEYLMQWSSIQL